MRTHFGTFRTASAIKNKPPNDSDCRRPTRRDKSALSSSQHPPSRHQRPAKLVRFPALMLSVAYAQECPLIATGCSPSHANGVQTSSIFSLVMAKITSPGFAFFDLAYCSSDHRGVLVPRSTKSRSATSRISSTVSSGYLLRATGTSVLIITINIP